MDLALTLEKINPLWCYLLNHSQADGAQVILEWRGPGKLPTPQELEDAWMLCLEDHAATVLKEQRRQEAIERVKADPVMVDVVEVLGL